MNLLRRSMISRLAGLAVLGLLSGSTQVSCNGGDGAIQIGDDRLPHSGNGPTFTTTLVLKDSAGTEKYEFQRGELITFEITLRNRTSQPVDISYTGRLAEDAVFRNGASSPVWFSSQGTFFAQVVDTHTLAANASEVFTLTWRQELENGSTLPRGMYEARGIIMAPGVLGPDSNWLNEHELASTLKAFRIN